MLEAGCVGSHTRQEVMRLAKNFAVALFLLGVYFLAGKLGLRLAFVNASATAVWPPTGIALAAFLLLGYRVWPVILVGAFLVNLTTAGAAATSVGIALGNTLEGALGAYLVTRFAGGRRAFDRAENVFKFAALAGMVSTALSATIGVTTLAAGGLARWADYAPIWLTWWLGDASGALLVAPVLVLWSRRPQRPWKSARFAEVGAFFVLLFGVAQAVFGGFFPSRTKNYPLEFLCIPFLIWAAFRFGQRASATAVVVLAGIATWGTLHGMGPFVRETQNESLLLLQAFMGVMAVMAMTLAAVVWERQRDEEALRESEAAFRVMADAVPVFIFTNRADGTCDYVNTRFYEYTAMPAGSAQGYGWAAALHPDDRERTQVLWRQSQITGESYEFRYRFRAADGSYRWFLGRARPIRGARGRIVKWFGSCADIENLVRAEESLRQAREELELRIAKRTAELAEANQALQTDNLERKRAEDEVRNLSARLLKLQDEERRRIARDLHDTTGQKVAAMALDLAVLSEEAGKLAARGREALGECYRLVEQIGNELRTLSYLLHPPLLDEVGLNSAIRWYADGVAQRSGLQLDLEVSPEVGRLSQEAETALFRIVQEGLTNVHLHSGSKRAQIRLLRDNGEIRLEISDDGKGIGGKGDGAQPLGVGITGMRERMKQLGGQLEVVSGDHGTIVRAILPVPADQQHAAQTRT